MFERFYKPESDFVYVRISSDIDNQQLIDHIISYNNEAKNKEGLLELCDCREITSADNLSVKQCVEASQLDIKTKRVVNGKLAFLVSNELIFGMARAFQMFAEESGREINFFYNIDNAIKFLNTKESNVEIIEFIENLKN